MLAKGKRSGKNVKHSNRKTVYLTAGKNLILSKKIAQGGGFEPPWMHGRANERSTDQATASRPLDPEAILFYILDI